MFVNPAIELVTVVDPNSWYAYTFPNFTTHFIINSDSTIQISTESDGSAYITAPASQGGFSQNLKARATGLVLYLSSPNAGAIARIVSWQN